MSSKTNKSSVIARLAERKLAGPPKWLPNSVVYETLMGSVAYGVESDTSDMDIYAICIPPKDLIFPHLAGEIPGFGTQIKRFEVYQEHHIHDPDALGGHGRTYDFQVFGIVKFFQLAMENNPNIIDSLFTPVSCVLHCTKIGNLIRDRRRDFLHKGSWFKFKGYSYSQVHKMNIKTPAEGSKRAADVAEFGFDRKFAYHVFDY
jgi:predicted nucleotidyltransferase